VVEQAPATSPRARTVAVTRWRRMEPCYGLTTAPPGPLARSLPCDANGTPHDDAPG
jgi:hypothetical protein